LFKLLFQKIPSADAHAIVADACVHTNALFRKISIKKTKSGIILQIISI